jgi:hypothetical protein
VCATTRQREAYPPGGTESSAGERIHADRVWSGILDGVGAFHPAGMGNHAHDATTCKHHVWLNAREPAHLKDAAAGRMTRRDPRSPPCLRAPPGTSGARGKDAPDTL